MNTRTRQLNEGDPEYYGAYDTIIEYKCPTCKQWKIYFPIIRQ